MTEEEITNHNNAVDQTEYAKAGGFIVWLNKEQAKKCIKYANDFWQKNKMVFKIDQRIEF